jgi:hypothetical protein
MAHIIEDNDYEELQKRINTLKQLTESMNTKYSKKKLNSLLNSEEVCQILNIKARALQTYRDTGKIGYSQIERIIFYHGRDVEKLLKDSYNKPKSQNLLI